MPDDTPQLSIRFRTIKLDASRSVSLSEVVKDRVRIVRFVNGARQTELAVSQEALDALAMLAVGDWEFPAA